MRSRVPELQDTVRTAHGHLDLYFALGITAELAADVGDVPAALVAVTVKV